MKYFVKVTNLISYIKELSKYKIIKNKNSINKIKFLIYKYQAKLV